MLLKLLQVGFVDHNHLAARSRRGCPDLAGVPIPRQQLVQARGRVAGQPLQNVGHPGLRANAIELSRLRDKDLIADPVNKAKSVVFTEEGSKRAEELFRAMFTKPD